MNTEHHDPMAGSIMEKIKKGDITMRPRWHFVVLSAFALVGVALVVATLLYVASLALFFMRDSGVWFTPALGARGWFDLLHSLPWLLILLVVLFVVLLEFLVRRYAFVYQRPLVVSILGVILVVAVGGFFIAPFHRGLFLSARHNTLPSPLGMWYGRMFRAPRPNDVYHGTVVAASSSGLIVSDIDGEGTSTIIITRETRLPYGADFSPGDYVVVVGDQVGTDTMRAWGIREIEE